MVIEWSIAGLVALALIHAAVYLRRWAWEARRNVPDSAWPNPQLQPRFAGFDADAFERGRVAFIKRQIGRLEAQLPERPAARLLAVKRAK